MEREELAAWLRLTLTPGVGNGAARKLLAAFGLPGSIFTRSLTALTQVVGPVHAASLLATPPGLAGLLETTWAWLNPVTAPGAKAATPEHRQILVLGDASYPASLLNIEDPPLMLYLAGAAQREEKEPESHAGKAQTAAKLIANSINLNACSVNSVAIVGSRNPTPQGLENARQFARGLSAAGVTVVSGLALGVDGAAHEGALEGVGLLDAGRIATIAVIGTGLDRVYPSRHRALAHAITRNGVIISEYPLGTPPLAANFPKRNRIIAGLAQGTLVVEAALKSGSLITARLASEQGKEVFAIPGSIHAVQSKGCHYLIRQGAKLVESVPDILEDLKLEFTINSVAGYACSEPILATISAENALLEALGFDPVSLDALQARTGLDTPALQAQLMALELNDQVARLPGGLFQRLVKA